MNGHGEPAGGQPLLTREILTLAVVVVLGAIMTILDATIVNVALPTLGRDFRTSISAIQWVPTVYLLAFASVIPASGWAAERFGARRVWITSLAAFMIGSLGCALSGSAAELIGFRVLQGAGGGMIMPVGQAHPQHRVDAERQAACLIAGPVRVGRGDLALERAHHQRADRRGEHRQRHRDPAQPWMPRLPLRAPLAASGSRA